VNRQEEKQRRGRGRAWLALALTAGLAACGGGETVADGASTAAAATGTAQITSVRRGTSTTATTIAQPSNTEGRLLASNCFQCHGTGGTGGFEEIRGKSANELIEFFDKPASGDIMAAHAQGYTPEQLRKVAAYLQQ
jgi:mono/diheme cytochrome c family protein